VYRLLLLALLAGCEQPPPGPTVHQLHAIIRPDSTGRWYVQNDVDHAPIGITTRVDQGPDFVRIFFTRGYSHAGTIQVTSDDDFRDRVSGHSNLGLNHATVRIVAGGQVIDPATVWDHAPVGSGNLWVSVTMVQAPQQ
jgi:hypothetical protein